jgi:hypothetical protein
MNKTLRLLLQNLAYNWNIKSVSLDWKVFRLTNKAGEYDELRPIVKAEYYECIEEESK